MKSDAIPERYRIAAAALPDGPYVAPSRDSVVGYLGTTEIGRVATFRCVTCCDAHPLTDARRWHGEDSKSFAYIAAEQAARGGADWWRGEACDLCRAEVLDLSMRCQAEHDAQQERWERQRTGAPMLIEYGIAVNPRCRVY